MSLSLFITIKLMCSQQNEYFPNTHPQLGITHDEMYNITHSPEIENIFSQGNHQSLFIQDHNSFEVQFINTNTQRTWFRYRLRERLQDGTPHYSFGPLTKWKYDNPIDQIPPGYRVYEKSQYWMHPDYPIESLYPTDLSLFIRKPYDLLSQIPSLDWIHMFKKIVALSDPPRPGSLGYRGIPGLWKHIEKHTTQTLANYGFTHASAIPTWLHIAQINKHMNYHFVCSKDTFNFMQLEHALTQNKIPLQSSIASWIVLLQYWVKQAKHEGIRPEKYIPTEYFLYNKNEIVTYNLSPKRNVWMIRTIK